MGKNGGTSAAGQLPGAAAPSPPLLGVRQAEAAEPSRAPPLIKDGDAVFFIGNSFFGWHDRPLPDWVAALGEAVTPPVHIRTGADIVFGTARLASFMKHPATQAALASHAYNVFVLQGEDTEAVDDKAEFHQAVRDFNRAIEAAGARTVLFMTWEFPWRRFIDELSVSYDEIGEELGIPVIPAGLLFKDCEHARQGELSYWLTSDTQHPHGELHQNEMGSAVNAYATFETLTGINPHGVNFVAPGNSNSDSLMKHFSDVAWTRVSRRLQFQP
ncbi:MAG TPA: hypothetical protein VGP07_26260 [Polyangia bacterium]